jgi:ADP-heptose:LPS heptosyltransferase
MKRRYPIKKKVLLVNITRLGDMLQATPTIAGIKLENPDCHITVLVEKQFEDICRVLPHIDQVVGIDLGFACRSLSSQGTGVIEAYEYVSDLIEKLKQEKFDYCLNMSSSAYTAILLKLLDVPQCGGWSADEEGYRVIESEWARLFATSVHHLNRQFNSLNLVDVFRCSADVDLHPNRLQVTVEPGAKEYAEGLLREASFTNTGPLIAVQAGASQAKRQWSPKKFVEMVKILDKRHKARIVLTGSPKELNIVSPILEGCASPNVVSVVGKTSIPQLVAVLSLCDVLVTGDTGPMHIAVAAGTPVVSMFLASAYGFETGPYSEGNLVLQPVIGCGPCNPNKACGKPDCHDALSPELLAHLAIARAQGDVTEVPTDLADPRSVIVYRSMFDELGFCDLVPLNRPEGDPYTRYRKAYRKLWLDDLGGIQTSQDTKPSERRSPLQVIDEGLDGLPKLATCAQHGRELIQRLRCLILDERAPTSRLKEVNTSLVELDREIEELGFQFNHLGALSRMFIFAKENLKGSDPLSLASQMEDIYRDLGRRCEKFREFYCCS